ncbi:hypothetical protein HK102_004249, partial [Quaeritorhiza haematococci]
MSTSGYQPLNDSQDWPSLPVQTPANTQEGGSSILRTSDDFQQQAKLKVVFDSPPPIPAAPAAETAEYQALADGVEENGGKIGGGQASGPLSFFSMFSSGGSGQPGRTSIELDNLGGGTGGDVGEGSIAFTAVPSQEVPLPSSSTQLSRKRTGSGTPPNSANRISRMLRQGGQATIKKVGDSQSVVYNDDSGNDGITPGITQQNWTWHSGLGCPDSSVPCPNVMLITANINGLSVASDEYELELSFAPQGDLNASDIIVDPGREFLEDDVNIVKYALTLRFNGDPINFPANQPMQTLSRKLHMASPNPNDYPFDEYLGDVVLLEGTFLNTSIPLNNSLLSTTNPNRTALNSTTRNRLDLAAQVFQTQRVQMYMAMSGKLRHWTAQTFVYDVSDGRDGTRLAFGIKVKRTISTKFFAIFITMVMIVLSLLVFGLALSVWIRERKVEPPTLSVPTGLL